MLFICRLSAIVTVLVVSSQLGAVVEAMEMLMRQPLHEGWKLRQLGRSDWYSAEVPGTVHTDLQRHDVIPDPFVGENEKTLQWIGYVDWEYRLEFAVSAEALARRNVELVFEGLDTYARAYLNDGLIVDGDNMFREWRVDVRTQLRPTNNVLRVVFRSPVQEDLPKKRRLGYELPAVNDVGEKTSPFTRKAPYHFGWDWGPRFVTAGIWKPVRLEAWDDARIVNVFYEQRELTDLQAKITAHVEIAGSPMAADREAQLIVGGIDGDPKTADKRFTLREGRQTIDVEISIDKPRRWWPNGLGEPSLYILRTALNVDDKTVDERDGRIGLRTLELRRASDEWGKSFEFVVNGVPVFAKGANWIPADSFTPRVTRKRYARLLDAARDANMNMLRVWGGGVYESDTFYDLADELGLMIWQDFMFACGLYPADEPFLESVEAEAAHNVARLRNHPSIVLWCGNNENEAGWQFWGWKKRLPQWLWNDYLKLYHELLPRVVERLDPTRPYWPSSPSANLEAPPGGPDNGDMHYWGVWHGKQPFEAFDQQAPRFMSEYGFQSFPEMRTVLSFATQDDLRIDSPVMLSHQKSGTGNQLIREYMLRYYPEPKDFTSFLYVSQVLQAEGIKRAAENLRRSRPRTMGSLYWQLNDCWPVASWSSIDYYGRWKALHYYARRFYADVLISPSLENERVLVYVLSDRLQTIQAKASARLLDFSGKILAQRHQDLALRPQSSEVALTLDLSEILKDRDRRSVFLSFALESDGRILSSNSLFLEPTKSLRLPQASLSTEVSSAGDAFAVTVSANRLARHVYLSVKGDDGVFDDNYFDVLPGRPVAVRYAPAARRTLAEMRRDLKAISIVDAF